MVLSSSAQNVARPKMRWLPRRGSKLFDFLAAFPLICWFLLCLCASLSTFAVALRALDVRHLSALAVLSVLSRLGTIVYLALAIGLLALRKPAIAGRRDGVARLVVMGGTFGGTAIVLLPVQVLPAWVLGLSCVLVLAGSVFSAYALTHLGRSFSLMAEARQLVTTGPYGAIRHPLYLGEQLSIIGIALQFISPLAAFLLVTQMACQLYRMNCEEQILEDAFSDYGAYRARTARLVPGLY